MDAPSASKTTILVLLGQDVPEDTPPTREAPDPLCLVVYPRLSAFLKESYPNQVAVLAGSSLETFLNRKDEVERVGNFTRVSGVVCPTSHCRKLSLSSLQRRPQTSLVPAGPFPFLARVFFGLVGGRGVGS